MSNFSHTENFTAVNNLINNNTKMSHKPNLTGEAVRNIQSIIYV